jgi:hypothetical protein
MRLVFVIALLLTSSNLIAQDSGAQQYAAQMESSGVFRHDANYSGYEVIYYSSGIATRDGAMASWLRSAPHRALVLAGKITDIACVGRYCVGRGGFVSRTVTKSILENPNTCQGGSCQSRTVTRSRFRLFR